MTRILGLPLLWAVLVGSAVAQANTKGSWDAVRRLDRGTSISLKAKRDVKCDFVDATEETGYSADAAFAFFLGLPFGLFTSRARSASSLVDAKSPVFMRVRR